MVKIRNVFGDEYKGRQGPAVYQRFYGRQVRRLWDGSKKNTAPQQEEQKRRFRVGLAFWESLSTAEREKLREYLREVGSDLTAQQWAVKVALSRPRVVVQSEEVLANLLMWKEDWDAIGWLYRQKITLTNSNSYDLKNYPVPIDLNGSNVGANLDWGRQGADLRFYDANGNKLRYYVETWDEQNKTAKVYVEVPQVRAGGTTNIYMYYGNAQAESESDIKAKWFIYEDMTKPPSGTLKGVAYYDDVNKRLVLTEAKNSVYGVLEYQDDFNSYYVEFESWAGDGSGADAVYFYAGGTTTPTSEDAWISGYIFANDEYTDDLQIRYNGTMDKLDTDEVSGKMLHSKVKMIRKSDGTYELELSNELGTITRNWSYQPQGNLLGVGGRTGGLNDWHIVYYLRVKRQAEQEPSATFGSEEVGQQMRKTTTTVTVKAIEHPAIKDVRVFDSEGNEVWRAEGLTNIMEGRIVTRVRLPDEVTEKGVRAIVRSIAGTVNIVHL